MPDRKHSGSFAPRPVEASGGDVKKLELVVKCDAVGVIDAIIAAISDIKINGVQLTVIHSGVGPISKSDLLMALTGSKLVLGFEVELMPKLEQFIKENGLEVHLYKVIYHLIEDLKKIGRGLLSVEPKEEIIGKAKIIALFKSRAKDSILGCEITEGTLEVGRNFRVVSAMGPIYTGKIESLQIEKKSVNKAKAGRQVGIKIHGFNKAKLGDLVESFRTEVPKDSFAWSPKGEVVYVDV